MNIQLHKEFGLNPTMPQCFVCKKETGEIALLGNNYKGQAPMHLILSIEPCEACRKEYLTNGVLLVEAENHFGRGNKIEKRPTGSFSILKDEAFKRIFNCEIPKEKIAMVEVGLLHKIGAI